MLVAARKACAFLDGVDYKAFSRDDMRMLAVERAVEIVGEASRKISASFRLIHPEVPWQEISGMRNVIAHDYGTVDYEVLYATVKKNIPELIPLLEAMVERGLNRGGDKPLAEPVAVYAV